VVVSEGVKPLASDAGTGITRAVETMTSVEVGLLLLSVREELLEETTAGDPVGAATPGTWVKVVDIVISVTTVVTDTEPPPGSVGAESKFVVLVTICLLMCRGK
jgi:hypothetical protein